MLLQEVIRNIVFYKGIMKPLLQSWSDSLSAEYSKKNYLLFYHRTAFGLSEAGTDQLMPDWIKQIRKDHQVFSFSESTGTSTMSYADTISWEHLTIIREKTTLELATSSNIVPIVLTDDLPYENAIGTSKTYVDSLVASTELTRTVISKMNNATTGLASENICSFLNLETHEQREYLGEFSLTHEETHLINFKEGGEYHEVNQEPITAVV